MPVWHASVAAHPIRPVIEWDDPTAGKAYSLLLRTLKGVGRGTLIVEQPTPESLAYHWRRRLNFAERALIDDVRDVRGTPEERQRLEAMRGYVPEAYLDRWLTDLRGQP